MTEVPINSRSRWDRGERALLHSVPAITCTCLAPDGAQAEPATFLHTRICVAQDTMQACRDNCELDVLCSLLGDPHKFYEDYEPTLGGEDFSFYGQAGVPAAFVFLGIRNETAGAVHGVHTPQFTLDEEVLQTGAAYLASLAVQSLNQEAATEAHQEL